MAKQKQMIAAEVPVEWVPAITKKRQSLSISKWLRGLIKAAIDPTGKLSEMSEPGRPTSAVPDSRR